VCSLWCCRAVVLWWLAARRNGTMMAHMCTSWQARTLGRKHTAEHAASSLSLYPILHAPAWPTAQRRPNGAWHWALQGKFHSARKRCARREARRADVEHTQREHAVASASAEWAAASSTAATWPYYLPTPREPAAAAPLAVESLKQAHRRRWHSLAGGQPAARLTAVRHFCSLWPRPTSRIPTAPRAPRPPSSAE
jgi:hypothetical protein